MTDKEEIIRALKLWFLPGDVFEIRILKAVAPGYLKPHTESGYFDYDNIPTAADAIGKLRAYAGAYVTINPVSPDLLARACNRLCPAESESTTADSDIVCRRWLLIDCDAVRKAKISSTDAEHEAALSKAREIRDGLSSLGWPMPVMLDSGNGAQMTYRIDLPADDGGLVQRVITEIAKASSEAVKVDLTVYNPARIWRIPGTMNCKGDSIPVRPHRMAKILEVPESVEIVPTELLQRLAGESSKTPSPHVESVVTSYQESPGFDIDEWIAKYAPDAGQPQSYKGGRKWIFNICPFNPEHDNKSATLTETPEGAIGFRCLHDHCLGNDWRKFRVMREPGCYDRRDDANLPSVDIGGIMNQHGQQESVASSSIIVPPEPEIIQPWRNVTNEDVMNCLDGTFLGELTEIYASVSRPPLPLEGALLKAIVTAACCLSGEASDEELVKRYGGNLGGVALVGHDRARMKINTSGGQLCNAYAMLVAPSACGKDIGGLIGKFSHMRNPDIYHADKTNVVPDWNLGTSGSAAGIAGMLTRKPNALLSISEMSSWLDKDCWQSKAAEFLTQVFGMGYFDENFSDRGRAGSSRSAVYCAPNIIANIQPNVFSEKVDIIDVETGFVGRFLIAKMPEFYGNPKNFDSIAIMKRMELAIQPFLRKRGIVEFEDGYSESLQQVFIGKCDQRFIPSWRRLCNEYYPRFVVMLSVTGDIRTQGEEVIITDDTRHRARLLVLWLFANAERVLSGIVESVGNSRIIEKQLKRIFCIVRDFDHGDGVLTSEISRTASGSGTTAKQRQDLLMELEARKWVARNADGRFSVLTPPPDLERGRKKKS